MKLKSLQLTLLALLVIRSTSVGNERAHAVLVVHKNEIVEASRSFGISPRLLASIVFAEHSLNVKPGENILDKALALSGYNASIGIAQIKVVTAEWIETQLQEKTSSFYNPAATSLFANDPSKNSVEQLSEPETNLLYAAAYVSMIVKVWEPLFREASYGEKTAGLVATIYSLGLSRSDGSLRLPHAQAKMNRFGEVAQSYYDSFEMVSEFLK